MTCYQLHATFFGSKRCPGGNTQAHPQTVQTVHLNEGRTPFCTVSSQKINKQTNTVSRSSSSQTMLEGVCGCFMPCNVFLAGNSEVSLVLQCFTAELITYIVCECDAPECMGSSSELIIGCSHPPLNQLFWHQITLIPMIGPIHSEGFLLPK